MRFYEIRITNASNGKPIIGADTKPFGPYTSYSNGKNNPGALNIEFDLPIVTFDAPAGAAYLRIWGVGLTVMGQSSNFNGANIEIYAGMQKGLPLANLQPTPGLVLASVIQQAYGNWQGLEQTLDFQIYGSYGTQVSTKNLIFNWMSGQDMTAAIIQCLKTAFPTAVIKSTVAQKIMLPYEPQPAFYQSVVQFAQYVRQASADIVGGDYLGIRIMATPTGFNLFDGSMQTTPRKINFTDLVGQPTWINFSTINFKTIMRADIAVGDYILMPQGPQITTAQTYSQYRDRATFQGTFQVISVRHLGHFKQNSGDSWVTVFDAVPSASSSNGQ